MNAEAPGISPGLRARLPFILILGLQVYVLLGFGAFELVIALQEYRYRRGSERLAEAVRAHEAPTVCTSTSTAAAVWVFLGRRAPSTKP